MNESPESPATLQAGVSVEAAARSLNVSRATVRRWIRSGKLSGERITRPQGSVFLVQLPRVSDESSQTSTPHSTPRDTRSKSTPQASQHASPVTTEPTEESAALIRMADLVEKLTQQNLELAGRVGYYQAETEQLRETLKALTAPREETEHVFSTEVDQVEPPARTWWQRLLWGS